MYCVYSLGVSTVEDARDSEQIRQDGTGDHQEKKTIKHQSTNMTILCSAAWIVAVRNAKVDGHWQREKKRLLPSDNLEGILKESFCNHSFALSLKQICSLCPQAHGAGDMDRSGTSVSTVYLFIVQWERPKSTRKKHKEGSKDKINDK